MLLVLPLSCFRVGVVWNVVAVGGAGPGTLLGPEGTDACGLGVGWSLVTGWSSGRTVLTVLLGGGDRRRV